MPVRTIDELLADVPALRALSPAHRAVIGGCAANRVFDPGDVLLAEGDRADQFFVIRSGAVAVEVAVPGRGRVTVETLHDGDLLGWSWLLPPFRTAFDARALATTHALVFDGACLRGTLEGDPALGYDFLKVLATVFTERLRDARLRLLDLYGAPGDG